MRKNLYESLFNLSSKSTKSKKLSLQVLRSKLDLINDYENYTGNDQEKLSKIILQFKKTFPGLDEDELEHEKLKLQRKINSIEKSLEESLVKELIRSLL